MRSAPTSRGFSYRIGIPVLMPGTDDERRAAAVALEELLDPEQRRRHDRRDDPGGDRLPREARRDRAGLQQHRVLVGGALRDGLDAPVRRELVVAEHAEHGVGVAHVDGEERGHLQ